MCCSLWERLQSRWIRHCGDRRADEHVAMFNEIDSTGSTQRDRVTGSASQARPPIAPRVFRAGKRRSA